MGPDHLFQKFFRKVFTLRKIQKSKYVVRVKVKGRKPLGLQFTGRDLQVVLGCESGIYGNNSGYVGTLWYQSSPRVTTPVVICVCVCSGAP